MQEVISNKTFSQKAAHVVDGIKDVFSAKSAYQRSLYRQAAKLTNQFGSYKGADRDRLKSSWIPGGKSADEDILFELPALRERSRDLGRNDANVAGILRTFLVNVISQGISVKPSLNAKRLKISDEKKEEIEEALKDVWTEWGKNCDVTGMHFECEAQPLIFRSFLENGESLIQITKKERSFRPFSTALNIIEPDRLETPFKLRQDKRIRSGVRVDSDGEPTGYWIKETHPGDMRLRDQKKSRNFKFVKARDEFGNRNIIHYFEKMRPGQSRGVPEITPSLSIFKDLGESLEAEVIAQRIAACIGIVIESETDSLMPENTAMQKEEAVEPGMWKRLFPGEKMQAFMPQRPGFMWDTFVERMLRVVATQTGLPYELIGKDFSKVNMASARVAIDEARRRFRMMQTSFCELIVKEIYGRVMDEAFLIGRVPVNDFFAKRNLYLEVKRKLPGWPSTEPLKDAKAIDTGLKNRSQTLKNVYDSRGEDWENDGLEQRKRELNKIEKLGLPEAGNTIKTIQEIVRTDGKSGSQKKEKEESKKDTE